MLSIAEVERALPANLKTSVSQELVDKINQITTDPIAAETIRDNFLSYSSVLKEGRFKTEDYLNAVAYVSYKIMGYTNQDSYARTFLNGIRKLVQQGVSSKDISSYVSAYNKEAGHSDLRAEHGAVLVAQQRHPPKAVNHLVHLMDNANSEKVQGDAAANLLAHLKEPETKKVELNLGTIDSSGLGDLNATLVKLAETQQELIRQGISTKKIAHQDIIEAEVIGDE